jgi:hypothetical protein
MMTRYNGSLKLKEWAFAIAKRSTDAQGEDRARPSPRRYHARHAAARHRVRTSIAKQPQPKRRSNRAPERSDARGREQMTAGIV